MSQIDNKVFKALSSNTRLEILRLLGREEYHITGLAKELNVSVPVTAKHVKILEEAGLLTRKQFGRTHILKSTVTNLHEIMNHAADDCEIEVEKGSNVLEALKKVCAVEITRVGNTEFVVSTDGKQGMYIYEIDGVISDKTVSEAKLENNTTIEWKELVPITQKKIHIKIKND